MCLFSTSSTRILTLGHQHSQIHPAKLPQVTKPALIPLTGATCLHPQHDCMLLSLGLMAALPGVFDHPSLAPEKLGFVHNIMGMSPRLCGSVPRPGLSPTYCTVLLPPQCRAYDVDAWRKLWDVSTDVIQQVVGKPAPTLPATGTLFA